MNIYLIDQDVVYGYDTYDSAVVAAESEEEARNIHPRGDWSSTHCWCAYPRYVNVTYIGIAKHHAIRGVILASFNAG